MCVYVGQWHAVWSLCIKWCKWHHRVNRSQCSLNMNMSPWNMNMSPCSLNKNMSTWNKYEHFFIAVWTWTCHHVIWTCHHAAWTWICHHSISTWTCHHLIGEFVTIYLVISLQPWKYLAVNMLQFILWTVPKHKHDFLVWTCHIW